ncbi:class I SAM-dependent methyltransferase [Candidatus Micrarchaeota archaeon]|nr:class I SAM-dependent methyltransferase [Candidatus Micrarchaeota archaeon]
MGEINYSSQWYTGKQFNYCEQGPARHHHRKRIEYVLKTIRSFDVTNPKILDAGCGDGVMTRYLTSIRGAKITGLDYNELRLKRARKLLPAVRFVKGDLLKMPFKTNSFDVVFLHHVLEHIKEDEKVLREIRRILRSGGYLLLGVPHEGGVIGRLRNNYVQPQIMKSTDHVQFYTPESLAAKIRSIKGFELERIEWIGGVLIPHYKLHMLFVQFKFFEDLFHDFAQKVPAFAGSLYFIVRKKQ